MCAHDKTHSPNPLLCQIQQRLAIPNSEGVTRQILAGEDKDVRAAVFMEVGCLYTWIWKYFFEDVHHVELLKWDPDFLISYIFETHLLWVPERFQIPDRNKWLADQIYDYLTWKRKCFENGAHTCQKPQHMCCRRISANHLPTKRVEGWCARGIEGMAQAEQQGPLDRPSDPSHFQVWTCDQMIQAIHLGFKQLKFVPAFLGTCADCGKSKPLITGAHGDSSQMFDEIEESVVMTSFDLLNARSTLQRRPERVTVQKGKKGKSWYGGFKPRSNQEVVFTRAELRRILRFSGMVNYSRIGRKVFRRRRGVVMGAALSPCKSGLVYRRFERRFLRSPLRWRLWGLQQLEENPPARLSELVVVIRIADDDVALSSVLCGECLSRKPGVVYPPPLRHAAEEWGTRFPIIDVGIEINGATFSIVRQSKNSTFSCGGVPDQLRVRYLPPLGAPLVTRKLMVSWITGSLALDWSRNPHPAHVTCLGLQLITELRLLGHSFAHLLRALRSVRHYRLRQIALFLVRLLSPFAHREKQLGISQPTHAYLWALPFFVHTLQSTLLIPWSLE